MIEHTSLLWLYIPSGYRSPTRQSCRKRCTRLKAFLWHYCTHMLYYDHNTDTLLFQSFLEYLRSISKICCIGFQRDIWYVFLLSAQFLHKQNPTLCLSQIPIMGMRLRFQMACNLSFLPLYRVLVGNINVENVWTMVG